MAKSRMDYIYNGAGHGEVADALLEHDMDPGYMRPWVSKKTGKKYVTVFNGYDKDGKPKYKNLVTNAPATLTRDAWLRVDEAIVRAARPRLRVWGDLVNAGLTYDIPDGMGTTVIQHQTMTDFGEAGLSMDPLDETRRDRPTVNLVNLPLPVVHAEFGFTAREMAVARRSRLPLDTTTAEQMTRKVIEKVEALTLGSLPTYTYGGGSVYGYRNYPDRITTAMTLPTAAGWTPMTTINEVLGMIQSLEDIFFNGPYVLYYSPSWSQYMNQDYSLAYNGETLRSRLGKIDGLTSMRKVDNLTGFQMILVQLTSDVVQAVTGMRLTTVQWEGKGGLARNFKIMAIMVPRLRSNASGETGIVHATAV